MLQKSLSAGAVPLRKVNNEWEVLILRSFKYWDFPKGMVEEGEYPWNAAIREVAEETGLTKFKTPFKHKFKETKPYGKGKVARYYLIEVVEDKEIILEPNPETGIIEHHEFRWLKLPEARTLLVPRVQEVLDWAINLTGH